MLGRPVSVLFPGAPERDLDELATLGGAPGIDTVVPIRRRDGRDLLAAITVRPLPEGAGTVALIKPMGPWLDPRQVQGRANPEWDRVLGHVLKELIELAGVDLAAIDRTDALAQVLVEQGRRIVPGTQCLMSLVPHDHQENFQIIAGAGPWAVTLVGSEWPRLGTVAGRAMERRAAIETVRLQERCSTPASTTSTVQVSPAAAGSASTAGRFWPATSPWSSSTRPASRQAPVRPAAAPTALETARPANRGPARQRADAAAWRPGPLAPGADQFGRQRHQVHRARRSRGEGFARQQDGPRCCPAL
jgi:hypothetical protein